MMFRFLVLPCCFIFCVTLTLVAQKRFACDGQLLIATNDGKNTSIHQVTFIPFAQPFLSILANYKGSFDALGFNPKDNYVYSVEQNTNTIVRHSLYNTVERIGNVTITDTLRANAGDCTADGLYICYDYGLHKMLVFDVTDQFKLLREISLFWDPTSPNQGMFKARLFDFAFDPNDSKTAYSYQANFDQNDGAPSATRGSMLKINLDFDSPNLGMVTPLGMVDPKNATHLAGFLFGPTSSLYGFGSASEGINPLQNTLFAISAGQGRTSQVLTHTPSSRLSDGCSCPYSLSFTNSAPTNGMYCNNDTRTFTLTIENNSYLPLTDLVLKDTFPEGTIIKSISNTYSGTIDTGTGVGTNILSISGLSLSAKQKFLIQIVIESIDAKDGPAYNQAFLHNLPPRFPENLASDDALSSTIGDRCNFYFITRGLINSKWETILPTDCQKANDGKIIVSSPEFIKEKYYEVSIRNLKGWKEYIDTVIIGEQNSFILDSLMPGEYQLFRFRSLDDNCSVSLMDTTILLEAPNNLLDLRVYSNSPVCVSGTLKLSSEMSPDGEILWRGPAIFGSEQASPFIENTTQNNKGTYVASAKYGFCTQKRDIEVDVKAQFNIDLVGADTYCERDTLRLEIIASDKSAALNYHWSGPNELVLDDSICTIPFVDLDHSGYYEVVADNGACFDTLGIDVKILPSPSLVLDDQLATDFCEPLILSPKVNDNHDISYQWYPSVGLSCHDCPNPQIQALVQPSYQLKVRNAYNCVDSASIQIILDKDNIAFAPNIFSSRGSSENRLFEIMPNCVVHFIHSLDIYDRYGNQVFASSASGPNEKIAAWDGMIFGKIAALGVYIWLAKAELVDGSIVYLSGDVTVL